MIVPSKMNGYCLGMIHRVFVLGAVVLTLIEAKAAPLTDEKLQKYFEGEVARIEASSFSGIETADELEEGPAETSSGIAGDAGA